MSPRALPGTVEGEVRKVRARLLRRLVTAGVAWSVALAALVLLLAIAAAGGGWERGRWIPLSLDGALVVALGILAALGIRFLRSGLREARVARSIEGAAGLPAGTVQGALELSRAVPPGVSGALARAAERRVAGHLAAPPGVLAGELGTTVDRWLRWGSGVALLLVAAVIVCGAAMPQRTGTALRGLAGAVALAVTPAFPPLEVSPGNAELLRGAPLDIHVRAPMRDRVTLRWTSPGELPGERTEEVVGEGVAFRFSSVTAPLTYWAETADGARSPRYTVTPVDPLFLSELRVELAFPPHTGRGVEELRGDIPPLVIPAGTRIRVEGRGSRELSSASLEPEDGGSSPVPLTVSVDRFAGSFVPASDGRYRWRMLDREGGALGVDPRPLEVTLTPDGPPSVRLILPGRDTLLPPGHRQPLVVEAEDDYGVTAVEIVAWRISAAGTREEPRTMRMEVPGSLGVQVRPILDVSGWGLVPGDTVRYYARAVDNHPSPRSGRTPEYVLRVAGSKEIRDLTRDRLEEAAERLGELAERAATQAEQGRDLERSLAGSQTPEARPARGGDTRSTPMDFQRREEIRRTLGGQEGLADQVDSLRAELRELEQDLRDFGLLDPGLRQDLRELQALLDEIASPELRERMRKLDEALERGGSQEIRDALRELAEAGNDFRDRLEESLERFRRAAAEQELRSTVAQTEELTRRQETVAAALEEGENLPLRAQQQEVLSREAELLAERMERLQERLQRAGEPEAAQAAAEAAREAREARAAMQEAVRAARQGRRPEASEAGEEAARRMQEALEELRDGQAEMQERMEAAVVEALRRTAADALAMARRQGELREEMRNPSAARRQQLRADEQALLQGLNNLAQNLAASTQGSSDVDRGVSTAIGRAMEAVQRTMEALEGQPGRAPSPQAGAEQAVVALNHVARAAMENASRLEAQGGQGGGSAESLLEQLEELARQQGELNARSGEILPMQLGAEAMRMQAEQLAQGQESVAGELGSMADRPGANQETLGDLEALAREAEALARELAGGRLDAETLRRQERLFQRLLDAGRTLEREDEDSEERRGRTAQEVERGMVRPLDPSALGLRYALPGSTELQGLPPAQRQLVLEYFERLNRLSPPAAVGPQPPGGGR